MHVQKKLLINVTPWKRWKIHLQDEKGVLILESQYDHLKKETNFSQRLISSSGFEEVWLIYNVDAHCPLRAVYHKVGMSFIFFSSCLG